MDADFWHRKWANNEIGFHEAMVNALLVKHFPALALEENRRVFLPLCGKTLDIHWLLSNGYRVVGAELSKLAVDQLFAELGVEPTVSSCGLTERYSSLNLDILVGSFSMCRPSCLARSTPFMTAPPWSPSPKKRVADTHPI